MRNHLSILGRWSGSGGRLGPRCRCCQEQFRTPKLVHTTPWRSADGTYLITMFGRTSVELKSMHFERAGGHGAAEALCLACRRAAVACLVCCSDSAELGHVLGTHDEGSVRRRVHVCSVVCEH